MEAMRWISDSLANGFVNSSHYVSRPREFLAQNSYVRQNDLRQLVHAAAVAAVPFWALACSRICGE